MTPIATDVSTYKLIHSMIRVKDPENSIAFYTLLGLSQINRLDITANGFSLYYMAYDGPESPSSGRHWTDRSGVIELTHHYGTENDPNCAYSSGNEKPDLGYGHVAITVDDKNATFKRLDAAGFTFQKIPTQSDSENVAFITDPDGYWVKVIGKSAPATIAGLRVNYTMLRVKDPISSLKFYQEVLGMALVQTMEQPQEGLTEYLLCYTGGKALAPADIPSFIADSEGLVKLSWIHGTETETGRVYHDGNSDPKGFGHLCISVDDLDVACKRFEAMNLQWPKRLNETNMNDMAFMTDPDGYWIELLQNEVLKLRARW